MNIRQCLWACAFLIGISTAALLSQDSHNEIAVDVNLVNVTATVIDGSGKSVDGLTAEDFRVFEDGKEQKISFFSHESQVPISVGVLIDNSGSLQDKLRQAVQTIRAIAATLSSNDEMFISTFNSRVEIRQRFTSNADAIQRSLNDIRPHGETAMFDAISAGLREMGSAKNRKRILILVSDGFDTKSRLNVGHAENLLNRSDTLLYAIGIDDADADKSLLHRPRYHIYDYMLGKLTSAGRGRLIRLYTGRNYDLRSLSELLLGELHQQYTIGYYRSATAANSESKNIEIHVLNPGLRVLTEKPKSD